MQEQDIQDSIIIEGIAQIDVRATEQPIELIAQDIVKRLQQGNDRIIDVSKMYLDNQSIIISSVKWISIDPTC